MEKENGHNNEKAALKYKIQALKHRMEVMKEKSVDAVTEIAITAAKLDEVREKQFHVSLEWVKSLPTSRYLSYSITNVCTLGHATEIGQKSNSAQRKFNWLLATSEGLHKEEKELAEDLEIFEESWIGTQEVRQAMMLELEELGDQLKQKQNNFDTRSKKQDRIHLTRRKATKRKLLRGGRRVLSDSALRIIKTLAKINAAKLARKMAANLQTP